MGIFNQHSNNNQPQQSFLRGLRGSPGVGFSLTQDGNYDMNNKKLKNVGEGVESSDAVTKHQLEVSMNSKADKASLTTFVKKNSPEVGGDLDMKGFEVKNMKLIPTGDLNATSKKYVDRKVNKKADITSLTQYVKKDSPEVGADLDMKGFEVKNMKLIPTGDLNATSKNYVDRKVNKKADITSLTQYVKKDSPEVGADLDMKGFEVKNMKLIPAGDLNATSKKYVDRKVNKKADITSLTQYVKKDSPEVVADLDMKGYRVTNLTNPTLYDSEAANKKYVDDSISKSHVKPSHTPRNIFQYLMNDVNEWSSEYGVKVESFSDLAESPHSWDKKVLNITPIKSGRNYRFRLGLQMFRMKTNESYSLIVELYNRDYKTWQRQQTYVNGTGMWVISSSTTKFQHQYGSSGDLYYTKTLIKFKKTSSTAPIFVYFTVHFDDNGGDMNTYPKDFKNQVYIVAYGIEGLSDHVDSGVYDAHEAFEIDKTKMKMLVPLDMNGKQLMNVNLDLKIGNLFKLIRLSAKNYSNIGKPKDTADVYDLFDHNGYRTYTSSTTMFIHSIQVYGIYENDSTGKPQIQIISGRGSIYPGSYISLFEGLFNKNKIRFTKAISFPAKNGIRGIFITHLNDKLHLSFYLVVSYM